MAAVASSEDRFTNVRKRTQHGLGVKAEGEGKICYIKTEDNASDALTKPLDRAKFTKHRNYMLGIADVEGLRTQREAEAAASAEKKKPNSSE
jgi:hypothetical protein